MKLIKVILVGDAAVGKSVFMARLMGKTADVDPTPTPTVSADFGVTSLKLNGVSYRVQLWDTAGAERFHSLTTAYYRGVDAVFILYDITKEHSFESVPRWLSDVGSSAVKTHCVVMTIGNKKDLEESRVISHDQARNFASYICSEENGILWTEISALKVENVSFAIQRLCEEVVEKSGGLLPVYIPSEWHNGIANGFSFSYEEDPPRSLWRRCC